MFNVALDAMGGDYGPIETIEAALKIINDHGYVVSLVVAVSYTQHRANETLR